MQNIQPGLSPYFFSKEYLAQEESWKTDDHDRELLECLAITSPTFERAYNLLGEADYAEYLNEAMSEGAAAPVSAPLTKRITRERRQFERARILFEVMKKLHHGSFFLESEAVSLVGEENLSQVISLTRKMLLKENIMLLHKNNGGFYLLND